MELENLMPRLAFRNAKTIWPVWLMNAAADHTEHGAQGDRPWWYRPAYELFTQFVAAAETDPVLAEWFLSRTSLLDSLYLVPTPRLIGRAVRNNVRQWRGRAQEPRRRGRHPRHYSVTGTGQMPMVTRNSFAGSAAVNRMGPSSAATHAAAPRCMVSLSSSA